MAGAIPFGCGQCMPCRVARRRQWTWRQVLESLVHEQNSFVTLTYEDSRLPEGGNLEPARLRDWLKRFRFQVSPSGTRVRYFAVGEYGDESHRPHYHLSLFGVGPAYVGTAKGFESTHSVIERTWGQGFVSCAEFNQATAQYTCGYVVKKLTFAGDPRLGGRVPEFARMSLRPGLGADAMAVIAQQLLKQAQSWSSGDVPNTLQIGSRKILIGRYLLARLRREAGLSDEYVKEVRDFVSMERSVHVLSLFKAARADAAGTPRAAYLASIEGKLASIEAKFKVFNARRGL